MTPSPSLGIITPPSRLYFAHAVQVSPQRFLIVLGTCSSDVDHSDESVLCVLVLSGDTYDETDATAVTVVFKPF